VGALVALAERKSASLNRLTLNELRSADNKFAPDALKLFDLKQALDRRNITGAPGAREVRKQLSRWRKRLS
jgi:argininosuccinate lyase